MICGVLFWHAGLVFSCAWPSNDLRQVTFWHWSLYQSVCTHTNFPVTCTHELYFSCICVCCKNSASACQSVHLSMYIYQLSYHWMGFC